MSTDHGFVLFSKFPFLLRLADDPAGRQRTSTVQRRTPFSRGQRPRPGGGPHVSILISNLLGQDYVAHSKVFTQTAGEPRGEDELRPVRHAFQARSFFEPIQGLLCPGGANACFNHQDRQPGWTTESRSAGCAGESLLRRELLEERLVFTLQREQDARVGESYVIGLVALSGWHAFAAQLLMSILLGSKGRESMAPQFYE
jgi:hypothetical protein